MGLERAQVRVVNGPGHPGAGFAVGKEAQQRGDDAIGGFGATADQFAVFHHFFVGQAVVHDHQVGFAPVHVVRRFRFNAQMAEIPEVFERLKDTATAGCPGVKNPCLVHGSVQQAGLRFAHAHAFEAVLVHRQVIQGVAGHQHGFRVDVQVFHQS